MAKYKAGDKVVVRKDLENGCEYWNEDKTDSYCVIPSMKKFSGEIVTIKKVIGNGVYTIEEDGGMCAWTDEMFEGKVKDVSEKKFISEVDNEGMVASFRIIIEKIIYNNPATIIFYRVPKVKNNKVVGISELKKVVAKCNVEEGDKYDKKIGLEVAIAKAFRKEIDKVLKKF
jgi:hypothetical protein